jgi:hypothetical protein
LTFTFLYGIYTAIGSVVSTITKPYGYTTIDNAMFGAIFIFGGVLGSFICGVILDKTAKYKFILSFLCF